MVLKGLPCCSQNVGV